MSVVAETTNFPGSSNLASASYEPDVENLTVTFQDGRSYLYYNVPPSVYRGLQSAASAGKFWNRHKQSFAYEEL